VTIVPGVIKINDRWLRSMGGAKYDVKENWMSTRAAVLAQMAQMLGGEVAQTLVTKGGRHDAGKANDTERASQIATMAILKWGLSEKWGRLSVPGDQDMQTYLNSLSAERKELFQNELQDMMNEARDLARSVLISNYDELLVPLGLALVEQGILNRDQLDKFYNERAQAIVPAGDPRLPQMLDAFNAAHPDLMAETSTRDAELLAELPRPTQVADVDKLRSDARDAARATVPLPTDIPLAGAGKSCRMVLIGRAP
jgi:hypothetical protein